jgi:hypothetical protein
MRKNYNLLVLALSLMVGGVAQAAILTSPSGINLDKLSTPWSSENYNRFVMTKAKVTLSKTFYFSATPSVALTSSSSLTGDSGFSVTTNYCTTTVDSAGCRVTVKYDPTGKASGTYGGVLTVGDLNVSLIATAAYKAPNIKAFDSLGMVVNSLDFGTIYQGVNTSQSRYFYVVDVNKASLNSVSTSVTGNYTITGSTCSADNLNQDPGLTSCAVYLSTISASLTLGSNNGTLTVGSNTYNITADVQASSARGASPNYVLESSSGRVIPNVSYTDSERTQTTRKVYFRDTNAQTTASTNLSLDTNSNLSLTGSTSCPNYRMNSGNYASVGSTCEIQIVGALNSSASGVFSTNLNTSINTGVYAVNRTLGITTGNTPLYKTYVATNDFEAREFHMATAAPSSSLLSMTLNIQDANLSSSLGDALTVYAEGDPGFSVSILTSNCVYSLHTLVGCAISVKFQNQTTNLGLYSTVIRVHTDKHEESFPVDILIQ